MKLTEKNFMLGKLKFSQNIERNMQNYKKFRDEIENILNRYLNKDWTETKKDTRKLNEISLKYNGQLGCEILATYESTLGKILINTREKGLLRETKIRFLEEIH